MNHQHWLSSCVVQISEGCFHTHTFIPPHKTTQRRPAKPTSRHHFAIQAQFMLPTRSQSTSFKLVCTFWQDHASAHTVNIQASQTTEEIHSSSSTVVTVAEVIWHSSNTEREWNLRVLSERSALFLAVMPALHPRSIPSCRRLHLVSLAIRTKSLFIINRKMQGCYTANEQCSNLSSLRCVVRSYTDIFQH